MTDEPGPLTKEIAGIITGRMARYKIGQVEMAEHVGVSQSQLSKMLRGLRPIDVDQADILCHMTGVDLEEVIKEAMAVLNDYDDLYNFRGSSPFVVDGLRDAPRSRSNVTRLRQTPTEEEAIEEQAVANVTEHEQPEIDEPGPEEGA